MPKKIRVTDKYICVFCNRVFKTREKAEEHEEGHDIVHVAFERNDWKRLVAIINTGNFDYMTESLAEAFRRHSRL